MTSIVSYEHVCTHAVHWLARIALRVQTPLRAKRTVESLAHLLPPIRGVSGARRAAETLQGRGSCLSRALAIGARLPGSEIVIGVDPRASTRLRAHAWVELDGSAIDPTDALDSVRSGSADVGHEVNGNVEVMARLR